MLVNADFFSRLSQDLYFDLLLKDCVICSKNLHKEASPPTGQVTKDNLPGFRNRKIITPTLISFANVIYNEEHTIILDDENLEDCKFNENPSSILQLLAQQIPVLITAMERIQPQSRFNFSYIEEVVNSLQSQKWCFFSPLFGNALECFFTAALHMEPTLVIKQNQECREFLQTEWNIKRIHYASNLGLVLYFEDNTK